MKTNANRIIKAVALAAAVSAVLCACNKADPDDKPSSTAPSVSQTTQSFTQETTAPEPPVAEPVTQPPETEKVTEKTTQKTTKPTTTKAASTSTPKPTQAITEKESETTKAPVEKTTRHKNPVVNAFIAADKIVGYRLISKDEIKKVAGDMADSSEIYYVRLDDGTQTYYMAVDFRTAQALALSNPQVLRELCRQLDEKQKLMAEEGGNEDYVLMDYTHLVGELEVHYIGYLLTGALGAENGPLSSFYNSCKVADLNIDENRLGPIIDIIGAICG